MSTSRQFRLVQASTFFALLILAEVTASTVASCRMLKGFDQSVATNDIVFVGTVTETANVNRWATVQVEEIWRGPDLPPTVTVKGGGADPNSGTSLDREYKVGMRYLFLPVLDAAGDLSDSGCTYTQAWEDGMAAMRPANARIGQVDGRGALMTLDLRPIVGIGGMVLLVVAIVAAAGVLARSRAD